MKTPVLYIVVPCYNEQEVLPFTSKMFLDKIIDLGAQGKIDPEKSRIMFVDDGSKDSTWEIISELSETHSQFKGVRLSRNRGHQNALMAGLFTAADECDVTISIDCDGQDDINAMDKMIDEYLGGCDVVYGVRNDRSSDTFFKRTTAQGFYKFLTLMGVEVIYNHADYRLLSSRAIDALKEFKEVNVYLRGMIPLVGFKSTSVEYARNERLAGESHYPLRKMLSLALNGITSMSIKPIRFITALGCIIAAISFIAVLWSVIAYFVGATVTGWASTVSIICFLGGIQLLCLGIIGEYIGKIYLEVKGRPRFIISERTDKDE